MGLTISGGSFVTNINSFFIGGLPQTSSASSIVTSNLTHHFDAGNATSYPGSGNVWYNLVGGTKPSASLVASPFYDATGGGYLNFNGTSQYATSSFSYVSKSFTLNMVLKIAPLASGFTGYRILSTAAGSHVIAIERQSDPGIITKIDTAQVTSGFWNTLFTNASGFMSSSQTTMLTLVSTSSSFALYRNGTLIATASDSYTSNNITNQEIEFTSDHYNTFYTSMSLYNILMYTSSLSSAEVTQNYNALKSRYSLP